jgi:hypothetical protein
MSQIKNVTTEMMLNEGDRGTDADQRRVAMVARLNQLLAERDRHARSLLEIDRAIADLRREAAEANALHDRLNGEGAYFSSFEVSGEELAARKLCPPEGVDERDLAECFARIMMGIRRRGESLREAEFLVQFEPQSGRVVAVGARRSGDRDWPRTLYRRFNATKRLEEP